MENHYIPKGLKVHLAKLASIGGVFSPEAAISVLGLTRKIAKGIIRVLAELSLIQYVDGKNLAVLKPIPSWAQ